MEYMDLIGVPFKDGGRDKDGLDCWGLVLLLLKRQGYVNIKDYDISAFNLKDINSELELNKYTWKKIDEPQPGCVVLLSNGCTPMANHVGMVVDSQRFIHAFAMTGVCLSHLNRWKSHIIGFYLPPEECTE